VNYQFGMHLTDKNLVDKVLKGDSQAFGIIIKNTEGLVAQIVFKMIPNTEDRKDLVQNIYLKAFHKLSSFKFQSKLSTWIAQIAYNNCLSHLEKKKLVLPGGGHDKDGSGEDTLALLSSRYGMDSYGGTEQFIDQKELSGILQVEINSLPPVYKTLISLYHQEELSYEEMVEITGLPEGTVKSYLFRARKMLKENLLAKYKKEAL
jgi:RNA polymerase sigma factor (sigma-70 family)